MPERHLPFIHRRLHRLLITVILEFILTAMGFHQDGRSLYVNLEKKKNSITLGG